MTVALKFSPSRSSKRDVGLPDEWTVKKLGEICSDVFSGRSKRMSGGRFPLYGSTGQIGLCDDTLYSGDAILVARVGANAGTTNRVSGTYGVTDNTIIVKANSEVSTDFLFLKLVSANLNSMVFGSGQPLITGTQLKNLDIPLPPLPEQRAIAEALGDVNALIAAQEKLIAKKRAIKTATMQRLLTGKQRLPGFGEGCGYKQTEIGVIPEDWQVHRTGDIVDLLTGYPFSSSKYVKNGIRLLRGANIKRGSVVWNDDVTQHWPEMTQDILKYELKAGDVVIAMDGSLVGRSFGQISKADLPCLLLQRVARLRAGEVSQDFLKHWVCSPIFTAHCDAVKTVTAIPHISPGDIRAFRISVPGTIQEQEQIARVINDMAAEIEALRKRLAKTKDIKKGIMQELLTGRTRLV